MAGPAVAVPVLSGHPSGRGQSGRKARTAEGSPRPNRASCAAPVLFRPGVLVLVLVARLDRVLPAALVARGPLRRRVQARGGIALPGLVVRLALVLALLVDDHLLALAAGAQ